MTEPPYQWENQQPPYPPQQPPQPLPPTASSPPPPQRKSRRPWMIAGIVAGAMLLLCCGGGGAALWWGYQSHQHRYGPDTTVIREVETSVLTFVFLEVPAGLSDQQLIDIGKRIAEEEGKPDSAIGQKYFWLVNDASVVEKWLDETQGGDPTKTEDSALLDHTEGSVAYTNDHWTAYKGSRNEILAKLD